MKRTPISPKVWGTALQKWWCLISERVDIPYFDDRGFLKKQERWKAVGSLQWWIVECRVVASHNHFRQPAQYLRRNLGLVWRIGSANLWWCVFQHGVIRSRNEWTVGLLTLTWSLVCYNERLSQQRNNHRSVLVCFADRTPTHKTHLCSTVWSQRAPHTQCAWLKTQHDLQASLCLKVSVVIWCVTCLIHGCSLTRLPPWALPLLHLPILPHNEKTQHIPHIFKLTQSTSCAIINNSHRFTSPKCLRLSQGSPG